MPSQSVMVLLLRSSSSSSQQDVIFAPSLNYADIIVDSSFSLSLDLAKLK